MNIRRVTYAALGLACLALVRPAASSADLIMKVGVTQVVFEWEAASGDPDYYGVWLSSAATGYDFYGVVKSRRVEIEIDPDERMSVYVRAIREHPTGGFEIGPASDVSDVVAAVATQTYDVTGSWLLRCRACGSSEQRKLSDASVVKEEFDFDSSWLLSARGRFLAGTEHLVWYEPESGLVRFTDPQGVERDSGIPAQGSPRSFPHTVDFDGDGFDELLFVDPSDENRLDVYTVVEAEGTPRIRKIVSMPGYAGGHLGPVRDYSGDGYDDLLWVYPGHFMAVWSTTDYHFPSNRWYFHDSYVLEEEPKVGYQVADASDYDGDGLVDLLWRGPEGDLSISYLFDRFLVRSARIPSVEDDLFYRVVGSVDVDGVPGSEIAVQHVITGRIWIVYPSREDRAVRDAILDPGKDWAVIDVGD